MMYLDWHKLYFGKVHPEEVKEAIKDNEWQKTRISMKGVSLAEKYYILSNYYNLHKDEGRLVEVRVTNYVTALSRGGLIKPKDYR